MLSPVARTQDTADTLNPRVSGPRRSRAARSERGVTVSNAPSFDEMLRTMVRDVVREEVARARPQADPDFDAHLSTRTAAQHAGVAIGTIRRWIREGKLRELRAGRHLRVRRADVDALLKGDRTGPDATPEELAQRAYGP